MINIAKVSDWLSQNTNDQLYPRLFLMSPNGTLLAYSKPVDIKELRDQAALISIAWKEHCQGRKPPTVFDNSSRDETSTVVSGSETSQLALKTLTIESRDCNILVRLLQPELLLILIGNIPPNKMRSFKIHAEAYGDPRYPSLEPLASRPPSSSNVPQGDATVEGSASNSPGGLLQGKAPSLLSNMSQREKDIRLGPLHMQRKRLDALADYILKDFGSTGFVMPADSDLQ